MKKILKGILCTEEEERHTKHKSTGKNKPNEKNIFNT
jgi:hypothetical protein